MHQKMANAKHPINYRRNGNNASAGGLQQQKAINHSMK